MVCYNSTPKFLKHNKSLLLGLCGSEESQNRSTNKSDEVDHTKKKKEDSRKRSLFTMMNNVFVSMSEARAIYEIMKP